MAENATPISLELSPERICYLVVRARGLDAKAEVEEPEPGADPADEDMREVLEDADDPTYQELVQLIDDLNEDQQIDLVALTWVGRGDFGRAEWDDARRQAREARSDHTASYLLGMPQLGDYLEEGLAELGFSCEDYEIGHL